VIRNTAILTLFFLLVPIFFSTVISGNDAAKKLHALLAEDWQWRLEQYPEATTYLGDHRYDNRLTDLSFEAIEKRKAHEREMLARIQQINRAELQGQDAVSYDLFLWDKKIEVESQRFPAELMPLSQMQGPQIEFPQLLGAMPYRRVKDYENYIARLLAFQGYVDQVIALMKRGLEKKWVPAAVPLRSVASQIEGQIVADITKSPLYPPLRSFPEEITEPERARLTEAARRAISESAIPALKKLNAFIKESYLPSCRQDVSAAALPDGQAYYDYSIRRLTTTSLSAKEIHELGKREVARIRKQMEEIIEKVGFKGSFLEFLDFLRADARFYFKRAEDLVIAYRDISKRADGELPKLFAELPRNTYAVREIPAYEAPAQTTAYYLPGAADGSRAGSYWVNTYKLETRPRYEMEALSLHEAVPGHHLQISRAQEMGGLPEFRRNGGYTAYVEGWALYAESLGDEMGFYTDPYSKFGQLTYEMWRACRLVVDTGLHAFGWTRQQAIDFMKENSAKTENDIIVEVDRYIVWPGQALAYKLGELKIKELRARAQAELKERFDIRKFHNALLDDGALPLDVLASRMGEWLAYQKGAGK
jgi:uncharacterized protein (DUF885 family)